MGEKTEYIRDGRAPIPLKESISKVMSANKQKNTKPEVLFRKALWSAGIKGYRLHWKTIPGRPDLVFIKNKLAVFINGCFWHRCHHCNLPYPKTNTSFWTQKFENNVKRDHKKNEALQVLGWNVVTIWECELKRNPLMWVLKIKTLIT